VLFLVVYAGLIGLTGWQFSRAPTGFIPNLDQGYLIVVIQLPPGSSLARTDAVVHRVGKILLETPGIIHTVQFAGFDGATFTNAPNAGAIFTPLAPFHERAEKGLSAAHIMADLRQRLGAVQDAFIITIAPPPVRGIGTAGGFKMYVQDKRGRGLPALEQATGELVAGGNQTPGCTCRTSAGEAGPRSSRRRASSCRVATRPPASSASSRSSTRGRPRSMPISTG
jgi:multidrug efflux pump subunit AcrB